MRAATLTRTAAARLALELVLQARREHSPISAATTVCFVESPHAGRCLMCGRTDAQAVAEHSNSWLQLLFDQLFFGMSTHTESRLADGAVSLVRVPPGRGLELWP